MAHVLGTVRFTPGEVRDVLSPGDSSEQHGIGREQIRVVVAVVPAAVQAVRVSRDQLADFDVVHGRERRSLA